MVEPRPDLCRELSIRNEMLPVQQQIVVIERLALLLAINVLAKQLSQLGFPVHAPGIGFLQDLGERFRCIRAP